MLIKKLLFILAFLFVFAALDAQNPPHPNGGSGPGSGNTPVGGGAPIGGGLIIMMIAGTVYAAKKTIAFKDRD